jgi:metallo-beta-lactamase family protein
MDVRVKFLGGASTVTGSKYLLEVNEKKILIDCGLYQGLKELRLRNWDDFPIHPQEIDIVIITHAHIDHTGYLPRLVKLGFGGKVYCTRPTMDLMAILLKDSAKLQEEEAEYARKKGYSRHQNPQALYTSDDVETVLPMLEPCDMNKQIEIADGINISFLYSGHILGASSVYMELKGNNQNKTLLFSGDIGRYTDPIFYPPFTPKQADIVFLESTYGDRVNPDEEVEKDFADAINDAHASGGCVLIPAFAVGRTQEVLYYIKKLRDENRIPKMSVYVDSPMAINATRLYVHYPDCHKLSLEELQHEETFLKFNGLHYCKTQESSTELNDIRSNAIIISASGMLAGGRILHHLFHRLPRENDTLIFVGFQAEGTRGRHILEGAESIKIFGQEVPVKCKRRIINGLSAHADRDELMQWARKIKDSPKMTFLVHGEKQSAESLAEHLKNELGWQCYVPEYLESFKLFNSI